MPTPPLSATQVLIDELLTRLAAVLPNIAVARYPGRPQDYRLAHPQGAVLVSYPSGQGGDAKLERGAHQWVTHTLGLILINRDLWDADGVLDHLDRLRDGLIGWQPTGATPLAFRGERLLQAEAGIWWYGADYATRRLITGVHP